MAIERGCGTRVAGGIYAESKLSPEGKPLEFFLIDPPLPVDPALGLSAIGVKLVQYVPTWHILDWVGSKHYLNVADFLEETRGHGLSRRLPKTLDFSKLTEKSSILLAHHRAIIQNPQPYFADRRRFHATMPPVAGWCPVDRLDHISASMLAGADPFITPAGIERPPMCAGLWWEDVEGGVSMDGLADAGSKPVRLVARSMPGFTYPAYCPPAGTIGGHVPGFFASFPITNLAVIRNREDEKDHLQALDRASRAGLHVTLEDE